MLMKLSKKASTRYSAINKLILGLAYLLASFTRFGFSLMKLNYLNTYLNLLPPSSEESPPDRILVKTAYLLITNN